MRFNTFINDEHVQFRNETLTIDCIQWLYGGDGDNSIMDANEQLLPQQLMAKLVTDDLTINCIHLTHMHACIICSLLCAVLFDSINVLSAPDMLYITEDRTFIAAFLSWWLAIVTNFVRSGKLCFAYSSSRTLCTCMCI